MGDTTTNNHTPHEMNTQNTTKTTTTRKPKTTYAERLAARKAKRNRPVSAATRRATKRHCEAAAIKTKREFAESFAGSIESASSTL